MRGVIGSPENRQPVCSAREDRHDLVRCRCEVDDVVGRSECTDASLIEAGAFGFDHRSREMPFSLDADVMLIHATQHDPAISRCGSGSAEDEPIAAKLDPAYVGWISEIGTQRLADERLKNIVGEMLDLRSGCWRIF